jgi:hypothetical protein
MHVIFSPNSRYEGIITYNLRQQSDDEIIITLMCIYDKSEINNVSDAYLRSLVQQIENSKQD